MKGCKNISMLNKCLASFLLVVLTVSTAGATLLSVSGPNSLRGAAPAIIAAPADINDGAAFNLGQQGFDEAQNILLAADLNVDAGVIAAGTVVSSHMIFLNNSAQDGNTLNTHSNVQWTFDGNILGVMSDYTGSLEIASSSFLGAPGTLYPLATFNARGIETDDSYSFVGNVLTFSDRIRQPGDWIRVITSSDEQVPEPTTMALLGAGLVGAAFRRRKQEV